MRDVRIASRQCTRSKYEVQYPHGAIVVTYDHGACYDPRLVESHLGSNNPDKAMTDEASSARMIRSRASLSRGAYQAM